MKASADYIVITIYVLGIIAILLIAELPTTRLPTTRLRPAASLVDYASKVCADNGGAETVTLKIKAPIASSIVCADGTEFGIDTK